MKRPSSNEIWYTTSDNEKIIINDYVLEQCEYKLVSNTYKDGLGILTFEDSISSIELELLCAEHKLTSIHIPDSVTSIETSAFGACTSLTEFKGKYASEDGRCLVENDYLISFAPAGLTEYAIPNYIRTIGDNAFNDCKNLTNITIPQSVKIIGEGAFAGCSKLTNIIIPDNIISIGDTAFANCSSLTNIDIPNGIIMLGRGTFFDCSSLVSITIPSSMTLIARNVFEGCSSLTEIYCKPSIPPKLFNFNSENISELKIYVPAQSVEAYKSNQYWSKYANNIIGYNFE